MNTQTNTTELGAALERVRPEWETLVKELIPEIRDDYRAFDDPFNEEDEPSMCLTVGATYKDGEISWNYQTGDNSYSGGAYLHRDWAVVTLTRESDPKEVAEQIIEELWELISE